MNQKYIFFFDQRVENKDLPFPLLLILHLLFSLQYLVITESKPLFNTSYYLEKLLFYRKK